MDFRHLVHRFWYFFWFVLLPLVISWVSVDLLDRADVVDEFEVWYVLLMFAVLVVGVYSIRDRLPFWQDKDENSPYNRRRRAKAAFAMVRKVSRTLKRKGYKVLGGIEFFSGRLLTHTLVTRRFNSETYQAFLTHVLAQTERPVLLIQDGARYHTSLSTRTFFAQHQARLSVYQLPSYSPDYNPIEFLWKQMKQRATHNKYFPAFDKLVTAVDETLSHFAHHKDEVKNLMGRYLEQLDLVPATQAV